MRSTFVLLVLLLGLLAGASLAFAGLFGLLLIVPISFALLVLYDYRIGVVLLAFMYPLKGSLLLPQPRGLNPITYVLVAGILGLLLKRFFSKRQLVLPPRLLVICMLLPLVLSVFVGMPNIELGARNLASIFPELRLDYAIYIKQYIFYPLCLVMFSILLSNAISDSKKPQRFVVLFALSASTIVIYVMAFTLISGVGWGAHRFVIGQAGMHYNTYGKLFALAFGPLLYVALAEKGSSRIFFGIAAAVVLAGTVFTFARAGMLAVMVTLVVFFWQRKSIGVLVLGVLLLSLLVLAAPEEWRVRMLQGSNEIAGSYRAEQFSALTSGRLASWTYLLPDIALSPVFGRGVGSTLWNSAVTNGLYGSTHPHNMYLQILLDIGIVGLLLIMYFYFRVLRAMGRLSNNDAVAPRIRAFLAGSRAALIGMLVLAFTGGDWFPDVEQLFLWMSLGVMFAYWRLEAQLPAMNNLALQPGLPVGENRRKFPRPVMYRR